MKLSMTHDGNGWDIFVTEYGIDRNFLAPDTGGLWEALPNGDRKQIKGTMQFHLSDNFGPAQTVMIDYFLQDCLDYQARIMESIENKGNPHAVTNAYWNEHGEKLREEIHHLVDWCVLDENTYSEKVVASFYEDPYSQEVFAVFVPERNYAGLLPRKAETTCPAGGLLGARWFGWKPVPTEKLSATSLGCSTNAALLEIQNAIRELHPYLQDAFTVK